MIFALSSKNSSIRDTRPLEGKYLTNQNTLFAKYWTQKAQTMLEILFVIEVKTIMNTNYKNIETFYTHCIQ